MTLGEVLEYADNIKPNAFPASVKIRWVNECEGLIQTEVFLWPPEKIQEHGYITDEDAELLVKAPHDKLYLSYLTAMIDFANGEYDKYDNSMQMFNSHVQEFVRWFTRNYHPADSDPWGRDEISAYSII